MIHQISFPPLHICAHRRCSNRISITLILDFRSHRHSILCPLDLFFVSISILLVQVQILLSPRNPHLWWLSSAFNWQKSSSCSLSFGREKASVSWDLPKNNDRNEINLDSHILRRLREESIFVRPSPWCTQQFGNDWVQTTTFERVVSCR